MAVHPILITGSPVLHDRAEPVTVFDEALATLVDDMFETMAAAPGVGLAGPQIGRPLRIFVFDWTDDDEVQHRGVAANPELWLSPIEPVAADEEEESEGCLSVPGERYPLKRADRVILRAQDVTGSPFELEADGWLARIFQHEYDHLDGTLYIDRLEHAYRKPIAKAIRKNGWGDSASSWMPGVDDLDA